MRSCTYFVAVALALSCAAVVAAAAGYPLYDYKFICDPERYTRLGLDMFKFPFCDRQLPYEVRARTLVNLMTLEEKAAQMGHQNAGVARLGIPPYNWWSEALHGVSDVGGGSQFGPVVPAATSFPSPILLAAAFNESLWMAIGEAVSTEARAMHNEGVAGLTFWSPNINVATDPRWGRILETPGEDPYVVGRYAVNYVRGLQDVKGQEVTADPYSRPLKVSSCCKHYTAYDLDYWRAPGNLLADRFHFSANVTKQEMTETFQPPFEACVKNGDVSAVMCSYNEVDGIPTCADARLLRGTVRSEWNLHGYIVSDCDSIQTIVQDQYFLDDTALDGVAQSLRAGLDLNCGDYYSRFLAPAAEAGLVKESDVDESLIKNYIVLMRLGLFDGNPLYDGLSRADVCTPEHIELARDAARQGITLLFNKPENDHNKWKLPLKSGANLKVAVVGPHAEATNAMLGNYHGVPCKAVSPAEGVRAYVKEVVTSKGCLDVACRNIDHIFAATQLVQANDVDVTVIVAGLDLSAEAEGLDRTSLHLPGYQALMIREVARATKGLGDHTRPVVLVLFSGGPVEVQEFRDNNDIDALLWAGYPGEQGGNAIADVIFGAYNPAGRLPVTWYHNDAVVMVPMSVMRLRPDEKLGYPGRTYRFNKDTRRDWAGSVVYQFGYGICYSWFGYDVLSSQNLVEKKLPAVAHCHPRHYTPCQAALVSDLDCTDSDLVLDVRVSNPGPSDGTEIAVIYHHPPKEIAGAPFKKVIGFQKVYLRRNEQKTLHFAFNACKSFSIVTDSGYEVLPAGDHSISISADYNERIFPFTVSLHGDDMIDI